MPYVENGVHFKKQEANDYQKGRNMEFVYVLNTRINSTTIPPMEHLPKPFNWDPNVVYTLRGSPENVFNPEQQKLISSFNNFVPIEQTSEDISTATASFMSIADASPSKKQKK